MEDTKRSKSKVSLLQKAHAGMEEVEIGAQHLGFLEHKALASSSFDSPGMENRVAYSGQECAHHAALMNPAIWSGLPEELLQRVFARLPLEGIIRLHCLSKEWNRILHSDDFKQMCADAHPKLFAIIPKASPGACFNVTLYNLRSNTWHAIQIDIEYWEPFYTMKSSDGGLVCFACSTFILVCNPLTRAVRALPLHSYNYGPPEMLQLVMDRVRKCYKVLIVSTNRHGHVLAQVFHSNTGDWTTTNLSDFKYFFGYRYWWNLLDQASGMYPLRVEGKPGVWDCTKRQSLEIPVVDDLLGDDSDFGLQQCALVHERLFVLRQKEREAIEDAGFLEYYFTEYQGDVESGVKWLKLKDHGCSHLRYPASNPYELPSVLACKGYLLVIAPNIPAGLHMLWDLSTGKWHALSLGLPKIMLLFDVICELEWDAVP